MPVLADIQTGAENPLRISSLRSKKPCSCTRQINALQVSTSCTSHSHTVSIGKKGEFYENVAIFPYFFTSYHDYPKSLKDKLKQQLMSSAHQDPYRIIQGQIQS